MSIHLFKLWPCLSIKPGLVTQQDIWNYNVHSSHSYSTDMAYKNTCLWRKVINPELGKNLGLLPALTRLGIMLSFFPPKELYSQWTGHVSCCCQGKDLSVRFWKFKNKVSKILHLKYIPLVFMLSFEIGGSTI